MSAFFVNEICGIPGATESACVRNLIACGRAFVGWSAAALSRSELLGRLADTLTAGAFTPTCSEQHLPGFIEKIDELRSKGVSNVYVIAANDGALRPARSPTLIPVSLRPLCLRKVRIRWTRALGSRGAGCTA